MEKFIIDLDDLLEGLGGKVKEDTKDLDSLMELAQGLDRNIFIGDIDNPEGLYSDTMAYLAAFRTDKEFEGKGYFSTLYKYVE